MSRTPSDPPVPTCRPSDDDKSRRIGQIDRAIAQIASRQRGVVGWQQLLDASVSPRAVRHRVERGRLHRVFRGAYLVGHDVAPELAVETAALLVSPAGALLSHLTAGGLWRMTDMPRVVDVTAARGRAGSRPGLRVHATGSLGERDRGIVRGLPVTAPARTLVDLAGRLGRGGLERAYEQAQILRIVEPGDVLDALERAPGRRGARTLRDLVAEQPTMTRSRGERLLLRALRDAGVERPETNVVAGGHEVDMLWRRARVVVEFDGFATHRTRAAFERDRRRDADLQAAGHRVVRATWRRLRDDPDGLAAQIAATIRYGLSPPEGR